MRRRRWRTIAAVSAVGAFVLAPVGAVTASANGPSDNVAASASTPNGPAVVAASAERGSTAVTLISGDRVLVHGGDGPVTIQPGPGRNGVAFRTLDKDGRISVIPSDAERPIADGRLDGRLFDVTGLIEMGLDDPSTAALPLLISTGFDTGSDADTGAYGETEDAREAVRALSSATGVDVSIADELPVIDAVAVELDKAGASDFLTEVIAPTARSTPEVSVWLDATFEVQLDETIPQVGAPTAWDAGYTGDGVTVAVLDTGVDTDHPDLAGKVVTSANFTGSPDADANGHGTHVASTLAGSGAASDGRYTGVAPAAELLSGKICDDDGMCAISAIIAGMEWATVEQGAAVVNLSIGGWYTGQDDPMIRALDRLTEQTGALFVVAAGNAGEIDSPAAADAALAVGAVDKADELADFSGRGPRPDDGALKPDLTAPGVDVTAAASTHAGIGEDYWTISGTSMATPHVAGAAALLAQRHPGWRSAELKAALAGSADPHPDLSVWEQGAGRLDIAAAVDRVVFASTPSLSFGIVRYPHDEPRTEELVYRNTGEADVTLSLEAELTDSAGEPTPTGAFTLAEDEVTVPAGGTAQVTATVDMSGDGPTGLYAGRVTARAGDDDVVTTPVGAVKEVESYDVAVAAIGRDGEPSQMVWQVSGPMYGAGALIENGAGTVRLPAGEYEIGAAIGPNLLDVPGGTRHERTTLVQPTFTVEDGATWTGDARDAAGFDVGFAGDDAPDTIEPFSASLLYRSRSTFGLLVETDTFDTLFSGQLGPDLPDHGASTTLQGGWGEPGRTGDFVDSTYVYAMAELHEGGLPTGYSRTIDPTEMARIDSAAYAHRPDDPDRTVVHSLSGQPPLPDGRSDIIITGLRWEVGLPARTDIFLASEHGEQTFWYQSLGEYADGIDPDPETGWPPFPVIELVGAGRYAPGSEHTERWNAAVLGPRALPDNPWSWRSGDTMGFQLPFFNDADGHAGFSEFDAATTTVYGDGELLGEVDGIGFYGSDLPAERTDYRVEIDVERSVSGLSSRQSAVWEYASEANGDDAFDPLPLWTISFEPAVDESNTASDEVVSWLPVRMRAEDGSDVGEVRRAPEVEVSFDDGDTWRRVPVLRDRGEHAWRALVVTPPATGADSVSLRAKAADDAGNRVEQTIIDAYALTSG